jgi:hypothetical protein
MMGKILKCSVIVFVLAAVGGALGSSGDESGEKIAPPKDQAAKALKTDEAEADEPEPTPEARVREQPEPDGRYAVNCDYYLLPEDFDSADYKFVAGGGRAQTS